MSERIEKSWGHEQIIHNGEYCCKLLVYSRLIASSLHYHEEKHESFVVASGIFELELRRGDAITHRDLYPGDHVVIPPGTLHRLRCNHAGTIVEASTHDDPLDCVRLEPSEA